MTGDRWAILWAVTVVTTAGAGICIWQARFNDSLLEFQRITNERLQRLESDKPH